MGMNEVIKENRKKAGLTQEQVADYLGISAPAVHKWEKGSSYPDITLLPVLARLLKVDVNTLFSFKEELTKQEINHFMEAVVEEIKNHGFKSGYDMAMEKIKEYPGCGNFIHAMALCLDGGLMFHVVEEDKETYRQKILELYEMSAEYGNEEIKERARFMLASKYMGNNEYGKAQKMLDLMPDRTELDKRMLQAELYTQQDQLDDAAVLLERKLMTEVNDLQNVLLKLSAIALKEKRFDDASHIAGISENAAKAFEMWEYNFWIVYFENAIRTQNKKESIHALKHMLKALLTPWDYSKSVLYCHMKQPVSLKDTDKQDEKEQIAKRLLAPILDEMQKSPCYDFLREEEEFKQLIEQYKSYCNTASFPI